MPELPEVETTARSLHRQVAGDVIESVWIGDKSNLLKSPAEEIARTLEGSRIEGVRRVGKHIVIDMRRDRAAAIARRPGPRRPDRRRVDRLPDRRRPARR